MNILRWAQLPSSDITAFNIYRSILGFQSPIAGLNGLTLQLNIDSTGIQTFLFTSDSPVDTLNASLTLARAYLSNDGTSFFVRCNNRVSGTLQIVGGTALTAMAQTARTISTLSESYLFATMAPALNFNTVLSLEDPDGVVNDYYAITTVGVSSNESRSSVFMQAVDYVGPLCILQGVVTTAQGARVVDSEVTATIVVPPTDVNTALLTKRRVTTLTGTDGRFQIPVLQGALILLEVPETGYGRQITVPNTAYAYVTDLAVDTDYQYPLGLNMYV